MPKQKICQSWICIVLLIVLIALVIILTMIYGKNILNMGKFPPEISACPGDSMQEGPSCTFTLEPIYYYVKKSGQEFIIYGPKLNKIFEDNKYQIANDKDISAESYSLVSQTPFTTITLKYQDQQKNGEATPSFIFNKETAEKIKGARFVTVSIPDTNVKIRFNTFYIPE
ncbi:MAG TPA: hypothetical protein P5229_03010 [Candidatus Gracilibacteria bacterium]|nr:hypothetical protein [Candidatus Gracilibacteria bacterium]HRY91286.1 hypothetical protein [Candidatus Gracilibacteria bacterium]